MAEAIHDVMTADAILRGGMLGVQRTLENAQGVENTKARRICEE